MIFAGARVRVLLAALAATGAILLLAASAEAATVVNGDFESGTLNGWQVVNRPPPPEQTGDWYVYTGTKLNLPLEFEPEVPPPPAGTFAAIVSQSAPGTHILYQDVVLEASYTHQLSLTAYYRSKEALETPEPNSLLVPEAEFGPSNQQFRIDVVKPSASIISLAPSDILATVFATKKEDPQEMGATAFTADLTPFAGQPVRLRFAELDNRGNLFAGVDSVSITSTAPPPPLAPPAPSNVFSFGKPALNKKKGTAKLPVTVPGTGTIQLTDVKKTKKKVKGKTLQAAAADTFQLPVKLTKSGRRSLLATGKLPVRVAVKFTPTGGTAATQTRKLALKLTP